jgi:hypothetical protein
MSTDSWRGSTLQAVSRIYWPNLLQVADLRHAECILAEILKLGSLFEACIVKLASTKPKDWCLFRVPITTPNTP